MSVPFDWNQKPLPDHLEYPTTPGQIGWNLETKDEDAVPTIELVGAAVMGAMFVLGVALGWLWHHQRVTS